MNIRRKLAGLSAFAILTSSMTTPLAGAVSFADTTGHWGESSINRWSDYGIVEGFGNGGFQPDGTMTRAQMAQILAKTLGLEATTDNRFTDVPDNAWYKDAILKCAKAGIMNGTTETTAAPNGNITREQAAAMLARALRIAEAGGSTEFSDSGNIAGYATGFIKALVDRKVIEGMGNNTFAPKANITRAAVAAILDRAISAYSNKDGDSLAASGSGITLVAAKDVTVTGNAADVLIAPAAKGTTKLNGVKVSGTLTMTAAGETLDIDSASDIASIVVPEGADSATINVAGKSQLDKFATDAKNTKLNIKGNSTADNVEIGKPAENTVVNIEKDSKVGNITTAADNVAVKGDGELSKMTVNDGKGVTIDGSVKTDKNNIVNNSQNDVKQGNNTIPPKGGSTTPSGGGGGGGSSNTPSTDNITPEITSANGSVTLLVNGQETKTVSAGDKVTMKVTPSNTYIVDAVSVTYNNGAKVDASKVDDSTYTFTVPEDATSLSITVAYKKTTTPPSDNRLTPDLSGIDTKKADVKVEVNGQVVEKLSIGDLVTLTVTPKDGYEIASVSVDTGAGDKPLPSKDGKTYEVAVPEGATQFKVTVICVTAAADADDFTYEAQNQGYAVMAEDATSLGSTVSIILDGSGKDEADKDIHYTKAVLNLKNATVGDLTIRAADTITDIEIKGAYSGDDEQIKNLTINAPKATVINTATTGTATIEAVDEVNSYHPFKKHKALMVRGKGRIKFPEADDKTVTGDDKIKPEDTVVTIASSENVNLAGPIQQVSVEAGSTGTINMAGVDSAAPVVKSASADVKVAGIAKNKTVQLEGKFKSVTTEGIVKLLNAIINFFKPTESGGAELVKVDEREANNSKITTFDATEADNVKIDVKADKVNAGSASKIELTDNANVGSLTSTCSGELNITGGAEGRAVIGSVDITETSEVTVKIDDKVSATQVAAVGDVDASKITVEMPDTDEATLTVVKKAPALVLTTDEIEGQLTLEAPAELEGKAILNGTKTDYVYKEVGVDDAVPTKCGDSSTELTTNKTYLVYHKADNVKYTVDGEAATVVVNKPVPVKSATVSGSVICGQKLTATPNSDATQNKDKESKENTAGFEYKWYSADSQNAAENQWQEISGETGKDLPIPTDGTLVGKYIRATIKSQYTSKAVWSKPTAERVTANMVAYNRLLKDANKQVLKYKTYTGSTADVLEGVLCVKAADMEKLTDAIDEAEKKIDGENKKDSTQRTPDNVFDACNILADALDAFDEVDKVPGTMTGVDAVKGALDKLVGEAITLKSYNNKDVKSSAQSGLDIEPTNYWVAKDIYDALDTYATTEDVDKTSLSAMQNRYEQLNNAMTAFKSAIKPGATIDTTNLDKQIADAKANLSAVYITGTLASDTLDIAKEMGITVKNDTPQPDDVLPTEMYVPADVWTTYFDFVKDAEKLEAANQSQVIDSLTNLTDGAKAFKTAMQPGTKDVDPPIVKLVSVRDNRNSEPEAGKTAEIVFSSNEAGNYTVSVSGTIVTADDNTPEDKAATFSEDVVRAEDQDLLNLDLANDKASGTGEIAAANNYKITLDNLKKYMSYDVTITVTDGPGNVGKALNVTLAGKYDDSVHGVNVSVQGSEDGSVTFNAEFVGLKDTNTEVKYQWYTYRIEDDTETPLPVLTETGEINRGWQEVDSATGETVKITKADIDKFPAGIYCYGCVAEYTYQEETAKVAGMDTSRKIVTDCTVTFDVDGDISTTEDQVPVTVSYNERLSSEQIPTSTKLNNKLIGWTDSANGADFDTKQPVKTNGLVLVPKWQDYSLSNAKIVATATGKFEVSGDTYTIYTTDAEGARITLTASAECATKDAALDYQWERKPHSNAGNTGWTPINGATSAEYSFVIDKTQTGECDYRCVISAKEKAEDTTAIAEAPTENTITVNVVAKYTVTLNYNNEASDSETVILADGSTFKDALDKADQNKLDWAKHVFKGWLKDGKAVNPDDAITADCTLDADWLGYGIAYDSYKLNNNAESLADPYEITVDTTSADTLTASVTAYGTAPTFNWQSSTDGTTWDTATGAVTDNAKAEGVASSTLTISKETEGVKYYKCTATTTATLNGETYTDTFEFAKVKVTVSSNTVKITFNLNGGNIDGIEDAVVKTVEKGNQLSSTDVPVPVKEGSNFIGWKLNNEGNLIQAADIYGKDITASASYTAQWKLIETPADKVFSSVKGEATVAGGHVTCTPDSTTEAHDYTVTADVDGEVTLTVTTDPVKTDATYTWTNATSEYKNNVAKVQATTEEKNVTCVVKAAGYDDVTVTFKVKATNAATVKYTVGIRGEMTNADASITGFGDISDYAVNGDTDKKNIMTVTLTPTLYEDGNKSSEKNVKYTWTGITSGANGVTIGADGKVTIDCASVGENGLTVNGVTCKATVGTDAAAVDTEVVTINLNIGKYTAASADKVFTSVKGEATVAEGNNVTCTPDSKTEAHDYTVTADVAGEVTLTVTTDPAETDATYTWTNATSESQNNVAKVQATTEEKNVTCVVKAAGYDDVTVTFKVKATNEKPTQTVEITDDKITANTDPSVKLEDDTKDTSVDWVYKLTADAGTSVTLTASAKCQGKTLSYKWTKADGTTELHTGGAYTFTATEGMETPIKCTISVEDDNNIKAIVYLVNITVDSKPATDEYKVQIKGKKSPELNAGESGPVVPVDFAEGEYVVETSSTTYKINQDTVPNVTLATFTPVLCNKEGVPLNEAGLGNVTYSWDVAADQDNVVSYDDAKKVLKINLANLTAEMNSKSFICTATVGSGEGAKTVTGTIKVNAKKYVAETTIEKAEIKGPEQYADNTDKPIYNITTNTNDFALTATATCKPENADLTYTWYSKATTDSAGTEISSSNTAFNISTPGTLKFNKPATVAEGVKYWCVIKPARGTEKSTPEVTVNVTQSTVVTPVIQKWNVEMTSPEGAKVEPDTTTENVYTDYIVTADANTTVTLKVTPTVEPSGTPTYTWGGTGITGDTNKETATFTVTKDATCQCKIDVTGGDSVTLTFKANVNPAYVVKLTSNMTKEDGTSVGFTGITNNTYKVNVDAATYKNIKSIQFTPQLLKDEENATGTVAYDWGTLSGTGVSTDTDNKTLKINCEAANFTTINKTFTCTAKVDNVTKASVTITVNAGPFVSSTASETPDTYIVLDNDTPANIPQYVYVNTPDTAKQEIYTYTLADDTQDITLKTSPANAQAKWFVRETDNGTYTAVTGNDGSGNHEGATYTVKANALSKALFFKVGVTADKAKTPVKVQLGAQVSVKNGGNYEQVNGSYTLEKDAKSIELKVTDIMMPTSQTSPTPEIKWSANATGVTATPDESNKEQCKITAGDDGFTDDFNVTVTIIYGTEGTEGCQSIKRTITIKKASDGGVTP